ncbi:hypothetical protein ACO2Q8_03510 [Larkinella sp. VNQ87]|uniref:TolB family protein n=1 Tax=Larkinella sp. VNQ87 TaxID=3400921 RepID=UPI003BFDED6E
MKHSLLLLWLVLLPFFNACKPKAVDPTKRVRPVDLKITVTSTDYKLDWEGINIDCVTSPCPDIADVEAQEYEVQIADSELGPFRSYQTFDASVKSIRIPAARVGQQIVARIVSKNKQAPPANSNPVMATMLGLSQSAYYPGFGLTGVGMGGDVTPDGSKATFLLTAPEAGSQPVTSLYVADLQYERAVSTKLVAPLATVASFSPDGKQLAYLSQTGNGFIIYDLATERAQTLPVSDTSRIYSVDWSPDGKWLAYSTVSNDASRLWKLATTGGPAVPLTPLLSVRGSAYLWRSDISWSPDGKFIAVSGVRTDETQQEWRVAVSLYSPDGNGEVRSFETQPGWIDTHPSFSPDGKQLAFLSTRTDPSAHTYSLWVRDVTTGQVRQVTLLPDLIPLADYAPRWLGNERLLFMATQRGQKGYFTVFL